MENYGFEYYRPSKELIQIIMPRVKEEFKKMKKEKYPFPALLISGIIESLNLKIKDIAKGVNFCLFGPRKGDIIDSIGKGINEQITRFWTYAPYFNKNLNEKIPIIKGEKFVSKFLDELKGQFDKEKIFPDKFYNNLSKEMLDYYHINKRGDRRFDVLVSPEKKDLELLIKSLPKVSYIKDIKTENKWIIN